MGLLAKLHYGVTELVGEVAGVLYTVTEECKYISSCFVVRMHCIAFIIVIYVSIFS